MTRNQQPSMHARRRGAAGRWLALLLVCACVAPRTAVGGESWTGGDDGAEAWAAADNAPGTGAAESVAPGTWNFDSLVEPAQAAPAATAPIRRNTTPTATTRNGTAALGVGVGVGLASVPFMIGDTGSGTCIGFQGLVEAHLSHPTLACARLNIAEANTALPVDRFYYSYRHFHNASEVSAYQYHETFDYDRHLVAGERTFWDGAASVEMRLPIERHLTSSVNTTLVPSQGVFELLDTTQPATRTELGNISAIFKYLLWDSDSVVVSGGLGVTLPTARDVDYNVVVDNTFDVEDMPGVTAEVTAVSSARFSNETVYLAPFLAWLVHPGGAWYHQGFLQVETAANPTRVTFISDGVAFFEQNGAPLGFYNYFADFPGRLDLFVQPIARLNLGLGRLLVDRPRAAGLRQASIMFEMHYTTKLGDADLTNVPLTTVASGGTPVLQTITIGSENNHVDILNAAVGASAQWRNWSVTNGFVAPVREAPDRGFDFEYNLQLQRLF